MDGDNLDACKALAVLYANTGDSKRSDEYLTKAVELAPDDAPAIYLEMGTRLLGAKNLGAGEIERGVGLVRKAIDLAPSMAPAYKTLGLALWKQEDWTGARQAFQKYLELNPEAGDRDQILDYLSRLPEE
jgi:tetratricopeptide (TPR) repeat protein